MQNLFVCDTTALYSGGRRTGSDSLKTAEKHGYTSEFLNCPIEIADGLDGRDVTDISAGFKHFKTVQVASVAENADGFVIFSHFKGHMAAFFGGAIKNISMGFASRAQKQRMHSDVRPSMKRENVHDAAFALIYVRQEQRSLPMMVIRRIII